MKPFAGCVVLFHLTFLLACREYRSPTDPMSPAPVYANLSGHVFSTGDAMPVAGARIEVPGYAPIISGDDGSYRMTAISSGLYLVRISKEGFFDTRVHVPITPYETGVFDFVLARNPGGLAAPCELSGFLWVIGAVGKSAYADAVVEILDGPQEGLKVANDEMGMYSFVGLVRGTIHVRASGGGGESQTQVVTLDGPTCIVSLNFEF